MGCIIGNEEVNKKFDPEDRNLVAGAITKVLEIIGAEEEYGGWGLGLDDGPRFVRIKDKRIPQGFSYVRAAVVAYQGLLELREKHQKEGKVIHLEQEKEFLVESIRRQRLSSLK